MDYNLNKINCSPKMTIKEMVVLEVFVQKSRLNGK